MLRADLLDAMDYMMQTVRKKTTFGGVQVLFIGDLLQLPQFGMKSGEPCAHGWIMNGAIGR
jgi:hypothetical protein